MLRLEPLDTDKNALITDREMKGIESDTNILTTLIVHFLSIFITGVVFFLWS